MPRGGTIGNKGGRPSTGRHKAFFYVTDDEESLLRNELERIRTEHPPRPPELPQEARLDQLEANGQQTMFNIPEATQEPAKRESCRICGTELQEETRPDNGNKFLRCPLWKQHRIATAK